ncbi:hypothetical protein MMC11_000837 [Xylographa trunciseda]|nr:hypothetical protein [Xylographa trunciseda]
MKQRFSSLDVKVIAHELSNSLCTLRLANVYDLSSRIFLLKFAKPNHREQMVIDSGFRCHLTSFSRATAAAPSAFVARLRKYLRTRRVTSVSQIGTDRIIEFQFSDGQYRLFLEFYAGGNIVLTDKELNILALLRIVSEGQDQEELRVGLTYSLENRQNFGGVPPLTKERVREGLQKALDRSEVGAIASAKRVKKKSGDVLRKALATTLTEFPPMLVDHALRVKEFDSNTPVEDVIKDDSVLDELMLVLEEARNVVREITAQETSKGYIIAKLTKPRASESGESQLDHDEVRDAKSEGLLYEDFHPFRPLQFEGVPETKIIEFDGFNKTVDEFFSSIEAQKLESRLTEREEQAKKKLASARQDHQKRVGGLQQVQELNVRKAQAIEANLQRVQEAIAAVNGLIAQGMDWVEIARLIEMEQARRNPVAEMIKLPLKLYENTATLLLSEVTFDDEDDFEGDETGSEVSDSEDEKSRTFKSVKSAKPEDRRLAVDVDLALSPWSNARQYYDQKKTAAVKEQKTLQSSAMALKNTEKKINADLKKGLKQEKEVLRPVRNLHWFEKFYYFISSDGYLVLSGRDAQQNEILYKRYLKKGDVYVHADLQGAASTIIKNKASISDSPIPPSTLSQAGSFTVTTSSAWDSNAVMSAWWVTADQVSKTALTGEYLTTGAFQIKGNKNFLPPAQLLLGFGVMFHISDASKARHMKHRLRDDTESGNSGGTGTTLVDESGAAKYEADEEIEQNQSDDDQRTDDESNPESIDGNKAEDADSKSEKDSDNEAENGNNDVHYANPLQPGQVKSDSGGQEIIAGSDTMLEPVPMVGDKRQTLDENAAAAAADPLDSDDSEPYHESKSGDEIALNESKPNPTTSGVRHLSAKERRLLRNGLSVSSTPSTAPTSDTEQPSDSAPPTSTDHKLLAATKKAPSSQSTPHIRGKHGQRNKRATKYAHQDDEDRALALHLLGSTATQQKASSDADSKAARDVEAAAQKERRREQHLRAQQSGKESEEIRRQNLEAGLGDDEDDAGVDLGLLENFVGTPLPGDEILDALVVCAPWDAIGARLRWRVKMQPGAVKKGKAVREILGHWGREAGDREKRKALGVGDDGYEEEKVRRREGQLVKALKEGEVVGVVPVGRCRVVIGGGGERSKASAGKGKRGGRGSKKAR